MIRFIQAAFKVTLIQIAVIAILAFLKYVIDSYQIVDKIKQPFLWLCLGAGVLFVFTIGIIGLIENKGQSVEELEAKPNKSAKEKFIVAIAYWGTIIPTWLGFTVALYYFIPSSILMAVGLYVGIVLANCVRLLSGKQPRVFNDK